MSDEIYYWTSTGSDELCDAMEGYHETEPERPHPHCVCDIEDVCELYDAESSEGGTCYRITYTLGPQLGGEAPSGTFVIEYQIDCLDHNGDVVTGVSGTYEEEVEFSDNPESSDYWAEKMAEFESDADDEIESIAEDVCYGSCEPPLLV